MALRNVLIEGVSGTGKTTVAEELERRGFHVVHGDRSLAYVGDPETGAPAARPANLTGVDLMRWSQAHHLWDVEQVESLIADRTRPVTFFRELPGTSQATSSDSTRCSCSTSTR